MRKDGMQMLGRIIKILVSLVIGVFIGWRIYPYIQPYISSQDNTIEDTTPEEVFQGEIYMIWLWAKL